MATIVKHDNWGFGANNRADVASLPVGRNRANVGQRAIREGVNVDILESGEFDSRIGFERVAPAASARCAVAGPQSLFYLDDTFLLARAADDNAFTQAGTVAFAGTTMVGTVFNSELFLSVSDGQMLRGVETELRRWGVPTTHAPLTATLVSGGALLPGTYQYAYTLVNAWGEEGATHFIGRVTTDETYRSFTLSDYPGIPEGYRVRTYVSTVNGSTLYLQSELTPEFSVVSGANPAYIEDARILLHFDSTDTSSVEWDEAQNITWVNDGDPALTTGVFDQGLTVGQGDIYSASDSLQVSGDGGSFQLTFRIQLDAALSFTILGAFGLDNGAVNLSFDPETGKLKFVAGGITGSFTDGALLEADALAFPPDQYVFVDIGQAATGNGWMYVGGILQSTYSLQFEQLAFDWGEGMWLGTAGPTSTTTAIDELVLRIGGAYEPYGMSYPTTPFTLSDATAPTLSDGAVSEQFINTVYDDTLELETFAMQEPMAGKLIANYNGVIALADGDTVWFTAPFRPHLIRPESTYFRFESDVTNLVPVDGGLYVTTRNNVFFLKNMETDTPDMRNVFTIGAVYGSACIIAPDKVAWMTAYGQAFGDDQGQVTLPHQTTYAPIAMSRAAAIMFTHNGNDIVVTAPVSGEKTQLAADDFVDAEVAQAVVRPGPSPDTVGFGTTFDAEVI